MDGWIRPTPHCDVVATATRALSGARPNDFGGLRAASPAPDSVPVLALSPGVRLLLLVLALAVACIAVRHLPENAEAEPVRAARTQEVQSVALDGRGLPTAALRDLLATRAGDLIDTAKLARDRAVLEEALVARGYLAAKVSEAQVMFDARGAAFVTFAIEQGPQFRVRSVTVTGTTAKDAGVVTLGEGELVIAERIARVREALTERLAARGKRSLVVANVRPDLATATADIELAAAR